VFARKMKLVGTISAVSVRLIHSVKMVTSVMGVNVYAEDLLMPQVTVWNA